MDNLTKVERSERMRLIRSKDSKFELRVRSAVHRLGYGCARRPLPFQAGFRGGRA